MLSVLLPLPLTANMEPLPVVLVGAGDIAACGSSGDEATAALLDTIEGSVFTLGDNVYDSGTRREFASCYDPTWGRHKERTRPAPGNHDYETAGASAYFRYFGAAAGDPNTGYYSYALGAWHIIVINSNCSSVGGCQAGSLQEAWLRADLAAHPVDCTLAYWHHPRFSSGPHGGAVEMRAIWQALYELGADVVLSGHDHDYERFAPQDPDGNSDPERGIRQFVVGTGGRSHYRFGRIQPNSEVRNSDTFGVLKLTLSATDYTWEFIPEHGKTFTDAGSGPCSAAPS
jgi:Calcineurin-like phosphoesterase